MAKIHILIEGYAHPGEGNTFVASSTAALIEIGSKKILFDPGTNADLLLTALQKIHVNSKDISFIYLSHYHPDHFLNIRLFPDLDIYDGELMWSNDKEDFHKGNFGVGDIEILKTPGHSPEHTSLLITTEEGKVCLAQDVFWWEDGKQKSDNKDDLLSLVDPYATDTEALRKSRELVLEKADWIIPGHGKKFKNPTK